MFLPSLLFFLFEFIRIVTSTDNCPVTLCGGNGRVPIKFPFQIANSLFSLPRCVYPGFELSCTSNSTILTLPFSGPFVVSNIDYNIQTIYLRDPESCLPERFLHHFSVENSPFYPDLLVNFTFLNCTSNTTEMVFEYRTVACLSNENFTVLATSTRNYDESSLPASCEKISNVVVPVSWGYWSGLEDDIRLTWSDPTCGFCEDRGQSCGFKSDSGLDTVCSDYPGSGAFFFFINHFDFCCILIN